MFVFEFLASGRPSRGLPTVAPSSSRRAKVGADDQNRTGDLVLTKDALCQLSYIGPPTLRRPPRGQLRRGRLWSADAAQLRPSRPPSVTNSYEQPGHCASGAPIGLPSVAANTVSVRRRMERETGIEPATNSLEGCDSTTELLPPSRSRAPLVRASAGKPASFPQPQPTSACRQFSQLTPVGEGWWRGKDSNLRSH